MKIFNIRNVILKSEIHRNIYFFIVIQIALKQVNFKMLGTFRASNVFAKKVCTNKLKIKIQILVPFSHSVIHKCHSLVFRFSQY